MPHLGPGQLAEEPLIKQLGAFAWQSIAAMAGQPENGVKSENGQRLHVSMLSIELGMPPNRAWDEFDEGSNLHFHYRAGVFGRRLVEGLFLFDGETIPDSELQTVQGRDDLARGLRPWAYVTHGFVARNRSTWAKLEVPAAFLTGAVAELATMPVGIAEHQTVERSGLIGGFPGWEQGGPLSTETQDAQYRYQVHPETDLNAVGLLYCARFPAIMAVGERRFLRERLSLSEPLVACLRLEHRRMYYFANSSREDQLEIRVDVRFCPPAATEAPSRLRAMGRFSFRTDLHRASDGVLLASSLVQKILRIPGDTKPLLTESQRLLARFQARG